MKYSFRTAVAGTRRAGTVPAAGMKFAQGLMIVALVALSAGGRLFAQDAKPDTKPVEKPAEAVRAAEPTYRLTYTVTETDGPKRLGVQHFSLTVNPGVSYSELRLGSKVPVVTGNAGPMREQQFTYIDVGLNVNAQLSVRSNGLMLDTKVEQSSVAEAPNADVHQPVIRQAVLKDTALLTVGKPVVLGSLDTPGSTRHLDVEVLMEQVK